MNHFIPWHRNPICVIDFETTGTDPETCMPVQVACVLINPDGPDKTWATLVDPGVPIHEDASEIHGIFTDDVKSAPEPSEACRDALAFAGAESIMCAYNAPYDSTILYRFAGLEGADEWLDPLVMIRVFDKYVGGKGRHKLAATCERWGVELDNAHDALGDAMATARLLMAMKPKLGDVTYSELIRRQENHRVKQEAEFQAWKTKQPPREDDPSETVDPETGEVTA